MSTKYEIALHYLRSEFSSCCTKSRHSQCGGSVQAKRSSDKICHCPCHDEVDQQ